MRLTSPEGPPVPTAVGAEKGTELEVRAHIRLEFNKESVTWNVPYYAIASAKIKIRVSMKNF